MPGNRSNVPVIVLTGSHGQVGFELRRSLAPLGHVVALRREDCDLSCPDELRRAIRLFRPQVIVNAAAYTAVDLAETDPEHVHAVNGVAPGVLAEEARALGSLLVHYSTDYVFDGSKVGGYVETDEPNPISVYGKSKLAGEQAIAMADACSLVLRTSWVAGAHGSNFVKTVVRLAQTQRSLRVVATQFGAPTTASLVADITAQIIGRHWLYGDKSAFAEGIYHLAASGVTNWCAYAMDVLDYAACRGVTLKAHASDVEAISHYEFPQAASRPANSCLDTTKLRETFGIHLPSWQEGVYLLLDQLLN